MTALCYTCQETPAGSPGELTACSAYCSGCQPRDSRPVAHGQHGCGLCLHVFGTLTMFDAHQETDYDQRPVITCRDPASLGAVRDHRGVWQTPEGLAARLAAAERGRAWALARAHHHDAPSGPAARAPAASQPFLVVPGTPGG